MTKHGKSLEGVDVLVDVHGFWTMLCMYSALHVLADCHQNTSFIIIALTSCMYVRNRANLTEDCLTIYVVLFQIWIARWYNVTTAYKLTLETRANYWLESNIKSTIDEYVSNSLICGMLSCVSKTSMVRLIKL
jgi:hypothetical protein